MSNVQIFVEGVADQKFIQDLIAEWYGIILKLGSVSKPSDIISLDGKDAFDSPQKLQLLSPQLQQLAIQGVKPVVIFDADIFTEQFQRLTIHSQTHNFTFFLFPNNELDGDLETLLQHIIHPNNQAIFNCWQAYEQCLQDHQTDMTDSGMFTTPARKTKIYAYLEALLGESKSEKEKIKEVNRDYRNPRHWNLDPTHPLLRPLKKFLDQFFTLQ